MRMANAPRLLLIVPGLGAEYPAIRHGILAATSRTAEARGDYHAGSIELAPKAR